MTAESVTAQQPSSRERRAVELLRNGYSKRQVMSFLGVDEHWLAGAVAAANAPAAPRPARLVPPPAEPTRDAIGGMLAQADDSTSKTAKRAAEKIRAQLVVLREALAAATEEDQAAKVNAAERAKLLEELAAADAARAELLQRAKALGIKAPSSSSARRSAATGEWIDNGDGTFISPRGNRYTQEQRDAMATTAERIRTASGKP